MSCYIFAFQISHFDEVIKNVDNFLYILENSLKTNQIFIEVNGTYQMGSLRLILSEGEVIKTLKEQEKFFAKYQKELLGKESIKKKLGSTQKISTTPVSSMTTIKEMDISQKNIQHKLDELTKSLNALQDITKDLKISSQAENEISTNHSLHSMSENFNICSNYLRSINYSNFITGNEAQQRILNWLHPDKEQLIDFLTDTNLFLQKNLAPFLQKPTILTQKQEPNNAHHLFFKNNLKNIRSKICDSFSTKWNELLKYSYSRELTEEINERIEASTDLWNTITNLNSNQIRAIEKEALQISLFKLRDLYAKKKKNELIFTTMDDKNRWIAAWTGHRKDQMTTLPYSLPLPLSNVVTLRYNRLDPSLQNNLKNSQETAITQFFSIYNNQIRTN